MFLFYFYIFGLGWGRGERLWGLGGGGDAQEGAGIRIEEFVAYCLHIFVLLFAVVGDVFMDVFRLNNINSKPYVRGSVVVCFASCLKFGFLQSIVYFDLFLFMLCLMYMRKLCML